MSRFACQFHSFSPHEIEHENNSSQNKLQRTHNVDRTKGQSLKLKSVFAEGPRKVKIEKMKRVFAKGSLQIEN